MANTDIPITHKNHLGEVFYLHLIPARRGKPDRYVFNKEIAEGGVFKMPDGYKISEAADGSLSLVRK